MTRYDYILFDLDGTLTESGEGIVNSVLYALKKRGIEETDRKKLYAFIGPPLFDSYEKLYGGTDEQAAQFVEDFREYYNSRGWAENSVYPGVEETLRELRAQGRILVVATAKPEQTSKKILSHFHLDSYFDLVAGATWDESRSKKEDVIAYALSKFGIRKEKCLMIGDRADDVSGAYKNGFPCVGVLYGYGTESELEKAGAAALCANVRDLPEVIAGLEEKNFY